MFDSISSQAAPAAQAPTHHDTRITVFPNRNRFEAGICCCLDHPAGDSQGYALLHVAVQCNSGTGSVGLRMLNLVGNALRAGIHSGYVAYLGDAEFAVLLQDTDDREAALYARTMATIITNFRMMWEDEMLSVSASIGGVMADECHDGHALLQQAAEAGKQARGKPGCKVHMEHARDTQIQYAPAQVMDLTDTLAQLSFA